MLILYSDESYNRNTICMGGWLAREHVWKQIEHKWKQRIEFESRVSIKKGLKPLSRYHAADCASRRGEFEGWHQDRQIRLTKRLIEMLQEQRTSGLWAVAIGASLEDFVDIEPSLSKHQLKKECYKFCVNLALRHLCHAMKNYFPGEKVTIFHDSGDFVADAQYAFSKFTDCSDQFVTLAPLRWDQAIALQPADMIAYEVMRLADKRFQGDSAIRKSLQQIMGKEIPGVYAYLKRGAFQEFKRRYLDVQS
jgi:hypothetical protein